MKKLLPLIKVLLFAPFFSFAQKAPLSFGENKANVQNVSATIPDKDWQTSAQQYLERSEYFFKSFPTQSFVSNKKQQLEFITDGATVTTRPVHFSAQEKQSKWNISLTLTQISKGFDGFRPLDGAITVKENFAQYTYQGFNIEYINDESGLRQNFVVKTKPAGNNDLQIDLSAGKNVFTTISKNNTVSFSDRKNGKAFLQYDGLKVWDANHNILDASMLLTKENDIAIVVKDKDAVYPITVDPLTHVPEWTTSADGVLPGVLNNLALQVDAIYGYTVAGVGDVNGDGYDDVAIGAPGAIDIIAGPATVVGAGAVFLYFGSATGLPTIPSRTLRATTPIANALFGYSIAGGNVTGSTAAGLKKNDIIVGAPGESYSTATSGLVTSATVTAGKVYIFDGATLTAGPASPLLSVFLNGSGFFSTGLAGVLGSNVTVNALFGFSVAAADDMTGDGLGEVIVGSPGYAGIQLLDVRSGGAFVFYSGNLATNTPTKLLAPSLIGFPILVNLDGLLFGFSVDGAGDYDKDGIADVVVGAPGGLNLGGPGFLGGSAYIYKGTGSGVNTSIKTQLTASGPLLGAVANLFGYNVKGVKGANGLRNGNILVSAPSGNLLSNVLNGLRLKTGSINVFAAKASPATTETPLQSFSSPRGSSLLTMLASLNINLSVLFGTSMDNMLDANCDGIGDIIVGEPLSTGVGLIGVNAVGGAAYVFTGNADGTYNTAPYWKLENSVSFNAGINAGSLLGYSVAGGGRTYGGLKSVRAYVGAPGEALNFSTGILQLGNTLGTLFSFAAGDNGLGKAYGFGFNCEVLINPDINVTHINVLVPGNVNTNDVVPALTTYGLPVPAGTNPAGATLVMNADGTYTFISPTPGVYVYAVPVCVPNQACVNSTLTITVLNTNSAPKPPVANTDIATTMMNQPVVINSLANDAPGNIGGALLPGTVVVSQAPLHGTTTVNATTGEITYTPTAGYSGMDTIRYMVCENSLPTSLCATAMQVITVKATGAANSTAASDDFINIPPNVTAFGNVKLNDVDPEGNAQTVGTQTTTIPGKGTLVLNGDGTYSFTPVNGFTGPVSFVYTTCDDGTPQACASATLDILVSAVLNPDLTPSTRLSNGTFIEANGTTRDFVIEVNEILNNATDNVGFPIQVRITKSDNFGYTFNTATASANVPGALTVNNPDWDLITNTNSTMVFQLKSSKNMNGLTTSRISLSLQVMSGAAIGAENQTVSIINGSGAEVNINNNSVVRILNIEN